MSVPTSPNANGDVASVLSEILASVKSLQQNHTNLASAVDAINGRVNILAGVKQVHDSAAPASRFTSGATASSSVQQKENELPQATPAATHEPVASTLPSSEAAPRRSSTSSKIILTSYPGQSGVDPLPMNWGHKDPNVRGPVVVSRHANTIRRRNGKSAQTFNFQFLTFM